MGQTLVCREERSGHARAISVRWLPGDIPRQRIFTRSKPPWCGFQVSLFPPETHHPVGNAWANGLTVTHHRVMENRCSRCATSVRARAKPPSRS